MTATILRFQSDFNATKLNYDKIVTSKTVSQVRACQIATYIINRYQTFMINMNANALTNITRVLVIYSRVSRENDCVCVLQLQIYLAALHYGRSLVTATTIKHSTV